MENLLNKDTEYSLKSAFGIWSGGHFMHFGKDLGRDGIFDLVKTAYENKIFHFITSDVYAQGAADTLLGEALSEYSRDSYFLSSAIGHDFYFGKRLGSAGFQRFTDPRLRDKSKYFEYLDMALDNTLERLKTNYLDLLMLHNPDNIGYSEKAVWDALDKLKNSGRVKNLGIAPGPANGFLLDIISCFENYSELIDWSMVILNPFEPWPMENVMKIARDNNIKLITRVVDYGGFFHGNIKSNFKFTEGDHRAYRPKNWLSLADDKWDKISHLVEKYKVTPLQLACLWNLHFDAVESVVPTLIEEVGENFKTAQEQLIELANLPNDIILSKEDFNLIRKFGDNVGSMTLKGSSSRHNFEDYQADHWPVDKRHFDIASRLGLDPSW